MLEAALLKSKQLLFDHPEGPGVLRLREPRSLFSPHNCRDSLLTPLWPIECEVIQDQIHHIGNPNLWLEIIFCIDNVFSYILRIVQGS